MRVAHSTGREAPGRRFMRQKTATPPENGTKASGIGHELGPLGILEFTVQRSVVGG
ncbi:MAG: hypothetical protein MK101_06770 [Phycisphaerales bacterium]|nr:hypothetical protein [Phycisphaerales bacterium]